MPQLSERRSKLIDTCIFVWRSHQDWQAHPTRSSLSSANQVTPAPDPPQEGCKSELQARIMHYTLLKGFEMTKTETSETQSLFIDWKLTLPAQSVHCIARIVSMVCRQILMQTPSVSLVCLGMSSIIRVLFMSLNCNFKGSCGESLIFLGLKKLKICCGSCKMVSK